jgi:BirA family biotin operon repressor/biotin-[acetyl-CoA-carboxylase] ligase
LFNARLVRVEADGRFVLMDEANQERSYLFKEVQYVL